MDAGIPTVDDIQQQQQQKAEYEERRAMIIDQILEPKAKER
jgi:DNA-binding TFAR19-related protein (PDSD5 family)